MDLWQRLDVAFSDDEKHALIGILHRWRAEHSTLVAYTNESGEWVDVDPNWAEPQRWMEGA